MGTTMMSFKKLIMSPLDMTLDMKHGGCKIARSLRLVKSARSLCEFVSCMVYGLSLSEFTVSSTKF